MGGRRSQREKEIKESKDKKTVKKRKKVKWDKQAGSHPESWKQTGTGGRVQ